MKGLITKLDFFTISREFGYRIALRFLFSKEKTFLSFLIKNHILM